MTYTIDDCGLIWGLVTVPPGVKVDDFYNSNIIEGIIDGYKKSRNDYTFNGKYKTGTLYNPIAFKTFGDNDLMFYTLFDDFAFPNRVLHPFHGYGKRDGNAEYENFEYQVVVGLNSYIASAQSANTLKTVFDPYDPDKSKLDSYLFTCATRFKINPIFLCGTGLDCVQLVKSYLSAEYERLDGKIILLNGVGCDELLMLNFSNDICAIAKFIYRIRNIQFKSLSAVKELYGNVRSKCIASEISKKEQKDIDEAHVFTSSYSLCGYALQSRMGELPGMLSSTDFLVKFTWDIKPGHIGSFTKKLQAEIKKLGLKGQEDRLFLNRSIVNYSLDGATFSTPRNLIETIDSFRAIDLDKSDIRKLHITVSVKDDENYLIINEDGGFQHVDSFDPGKHPSTPHIFKKSIFSADDMSALRGALGRGRISKALKERVMKMYQNFNDCIQDPQFVVSFLSLRAFLMHIIEVIAQYNAGKLEFSANNIHEWLDECVRDFEQAYLNRFHQSNRMRTLSDFNIEWNGGIQQLICSMDHTYKTLMKTCGVKDPYAFMYVSGHERVHVNDHVYRINMQHITYPELFASTIWKEFFNFVPQLVKLRDDKIILPFESLMNDEFVTALQGRISSHIKFNGSKPTHKIFLKHVNKEFRTVMIADLMTFYYGYNSSFDEFTFWYIRYFLQTPGSYNRDGTVFLDNFIIFFCRIMLVHRLAGATESDLEALRFNPPDPSIASLWTELFSDVLTLSSLLTDILAPYHFVETVKGVVTTMLSHQFHIASTILPPGVVLPPDAVYTVISQTRSKLIDKYSDSFGSSEVDTDLSSDVPADTRASELVSCMLPGFLKYLRGIICDGNRPGIALMRDSEGRPDIDEDSVGYFCPLLADPFGGSFSIDGDMHVKYFKARSLFYLYLFHSYHCTVSVI